MVYKNYVCMQIYLYTFFLKWYNSVLTLSLLIPTCSQIIQEFYNNIIYNIKVDI